MATLCRCDRCKAEVNLIHKRSTKLPLFYYEKYDEDNEFDWKVVDLCHDCIKSLISWFSEKGK